MNPYAKVPLVSNRVRFDRILRISSRTALLAIAGLAGGCATAPQPGTQVPRQGDEILVAGQLFHTGTPIVLWMDPDGYDAYRTERRFSPRDEADWSSSREAVPALSSPQRYNARQVGLTDEERERVRGGGWDLPLLQRVVDQVVLHYDAAGTSRECFRILHDVAGLSAHFLIDLDGTVYQTLDLKERAWHATTSNTRSIGIELANIGAYEPDEKHPLHAWYTRDPDGRVRISLPDELGDGGIRTAGFIGRPARDEPVTGRIHNRKLVQYDFTPEQYRALAHVTAALCRIFPVVRPDYPRDEDGNLIAGKLPDDELDRYQGFLGHFHIQTEKIDPGPAFDWDRLVEKTTQLLRSR